MCRMWRNIGSTDEFGCALDRKKQEQKTKQGGEKAIDDNDVVFPWTAFGWFSRSEMERGGGFCHSVRDIGLDIPRPSRAWKVSLLRPKKGSLFKNNELGI